VALATLKPTSPSRAAAQKPKVQGLDTPVKASKLKLAETVVGNPVERRDSSITQDGNPTPVLPYELTPTVTATTKKAQVKRKEAAITKTFWMGVVSLAVLVFSWWSMYTYFVVGRANDLVPVWVMSIQTNFGKIIFVTVVMLLLISICSAVESFPKMIANSGSIQLVGQVSFGIYCWHLLFLS